MTFIQFLILYLITHSGTALGHVLINRATEIPSEKKTLAQMFLSGDLQSEKSVPEQVSEMIDEIEFCELDDDMTVVDIESVKKRLSEKNQRLREIVLEIN